MRCLTMFGMHNTIILSTYYCNHKSRKVGTLKMKFGQLIFTDCTLNSEHSQTWLTCLDQDRKLMLMIFAFCHLSAMTSVMTNPVMYGFLNENFKTSLVYILSNFCCFKRIFPTNLQVRSNKYCTSHLFSLEIHVIFLPKTTLRRIKYTLNSGYLKAIYTKYL